MITAHLEASNKADWIIQVSVSDIETAQPIDFTGSDICFEVKDENCCTKLKALTSDGSILILSDDGAFQINFTPTQMRGLCPGTYQIGCVYNINDETTQLFVGSVAIYDGVARL